MSDRPIRPTIRTRDADGDGADGLDPDLLREALSCWASGVAVLAVSDGEEIDAITVTAFSAASLDPPLVLACVHEHASALPMVLEERRFTVSILAEDQQRTGSAVAQRLPGSAAGFRAGGDPVLEGSLAALVCRLWQAYPGGDHRILVGEVERVVLGPERGALAYFRRGYRRLSSG